MRRLPGVPFYGANDHCKFFVFLFYFESQRANGTTTLSGGGCKI